jgi:hypothetical protein
MARSVSVPYVVDVIRVEDPDEIRLLAGDRNLDRAFTARGPLLNRVIARRIRTTLRTDGGRLPSALMRDDMGRRETHGALLTRFGADPDGVIAGLGDSVDAAARYVAGADDRAAGPIAQELFGRLFKPGFRSDPETWEAARSLDRALSGKNPLRRLLDGLLARVAQAQTRLAHAFDGDRAAVHAAGIAVHNFVASLEALRALHQSTAEPRLVSPDEAWAAALVAPDTVVRQAERVAETTGGTVRPGTLVLLETGIAARRSLDPRVAFLRDAWSGCPAHALVPALGREIWRRAVAGPSP